MPSAMRAACTGIGPWVPPAVVRRRCGHEQCATPADHAMAMPMRVEERTRGGAERPWVAAARRVAIARTAKNITVNPVEGPRVAQLDTPSAVRVGRGDGLLRIGPLVRRRWRAAAGWHWTRTFCAACRDLWVLGGAVLFALRIVVPRSAVRCRGAGSPRPGIFSLQDFAGTSIFSVRRDCRDSRQDALICRRQRALIAHAELMRSRDRVAGRPGVGAPTRRREPQLRASLVGGWLRSSPVGLRSLGLRWRLAAA